MNLFRSVFLCTSDEISQGVKRADQEKPASQEKYEEKRKMMSTPKKWIGMMLNVHLNCFSVTSSGLAPL